MVDLSIAICYPVVNSHNYGKSPFLMGKHTISMATFHMPQITRGHSKNNQQLGLSPKISDKPETIWTDPQYAMICRYMYTQRAVIHWSMN